MNRRNPVGGIYWRFFLINQRLLTITSSLNWITQWHITPGTAHFKYTQFNSIYDLTSRPPIKQFQNFLKCLNWIQFLKLKSLAAQYLHWEIVICWAEWEIAYLYRRISWIPAHGHSIIRHLSNIASLYTLTVLCICTKKSPGKGSQCGIDFRNKEV